MQCVGFWSAGTVCDEYAESIVPVLEVISDNSLIKAFIGDDFGQIERIDETCEQVIRRETGAQYDV